MSQGTSRPYQCWFCDSRFKTKPACTKHMMEKHPYRADWVEYGRRLGMTHEQLPEVIRKQIKGGA